MKAIVTKMEGQTNLVAPYEKNPEFGRIMVRNDESVSISATGFLSKSPRVAWIGGRVDTLQEIVDTFNLREGDDWSEKVIPIKLVVKEQANPFWETQNAKINPSTGELVLYKDQPVYRNVFVYPETSDEQDVFLKDLNSSTSSKPAVEVIVAEDEDEATVFNSQKVVRK